MLHHTIERSRSPIEIVEAMQSAIAMKTGAPVSALRHQLTIQLPKTLPVTYTVDLIPDDDVFLATCSELPEVRTYGVSEEDTLAMAQEAIEDALWAHRSRLASAV